MYVHTDPTGKRFPSSKSSSPHYNNITLVPVAAFALQSAQKILSLFQRSWHFIPSDQHTPEFTEDVKWEAIDRRRLVRCLWLSPRIDRWWASSIISSLPLSSLHDEMANSPLIFLPFGVYQAYHSAWPKREPTLVAADHVTARLMQELWYFIPSTKKEDVCTCTGTFHNDKGFNIVHKTLIPADLEEMHSVIWRREATFIA